MNPRSDFGSLEPKTHHTGEPGASATGASRTKFTQIHEDQALRPVVDVFDVGAVLQNELAAAVHLGAH